MSNLTVVGFANKRTTMDKVVEELQPPNGKILHTSLLKLMKQVSKQRSKRLKQKFGDFERQS